VERRSAEMLHEDAERAATLEQGREQAKACLSDEE
jgi:hypothetical protein